MENILGPTEWVQLRNNRWVATYGAESEDAALKTVADLRDAQFVQLRAARQCASSCVDEVE